MITSNQIIPFEKSVGQPPQPSGAWWSFGWSRRVWFVYFAIPLEKILT